ncbi:lipopolysaccharide biosynthesis protein [Microbacterium tumbae]
MTSSEPTGAPSLRIRAARGGAVTLVAQIARTAILLLSTFLLARLISPTDFGLFAMVVALTGIAEIFRDFGLSMAALQARTLSQGQKSNLFWINGSVGFVLAAVVFGCSWWIAGFYGRPELVPVVQAIAPVYVLNGLSTQFRVAINRAMRFTALALCDVVPVFMGFLLATVLAFLGGGVGALVAQQVLTALLTLLMSVMLARWWPSLPKQRTGMRPLLSFGFSFFVTQLLTYATRNVDSVAIGRVWGAAPLGLYDRAFQLAVAPLNQINAPMSKVALPALVKVVDDRKRFATAIREAQLVACYVTASALLLIAGASVPLVDLLLGHQWVAAGPILAFLAIGSIFRAAQQVSYWMFISHGMAGSHLRMHLVAQPTIIACTLGGLPWGAVGVAIGNAVGCVLFWMLSLLWAGRVTKNDVRVLIVDAARAIGLFGAPAGVIALACSLFLSLDSGWKLLIAVGLALGWYFLAIVMFRTVRNDMRSLLRFGKLAFAR